MNTGSTTDRTPDWIPEQLREIAASVTRGERKTVTVRELLAWFSYKRRTPWVVGWIRQAFRKLSISTEPDFDWTYLDGPITFSVKPYNPAESAIPAAEQNVSHTVDAVISADAILVTAPDVKNADPMHRIARLKSANTEPVSLAPDAEVEKAITLMMKHNYSQLPVMCRRTLKGFIGWKTIGRRFVIGKEVQYVREAMEEVQPSQVVALTASLLEATRLLAMHDFLLVRDHTSTICGIITAYDFTETFGSLSEPFLLVGEIENHIRNIMNGKFSKEDLQKARDPRDGDSSINQISDLNFGAYVRLLQVPNNWEKLGLRLDKDTFIRDLDEVREIRNDIMHFDPDGIAPEELTKVREFSNLLRQIHQLRES